MKATRNHSNHVRVADPMEALQSDISDLKRDLGALINGRMHAVGDAVSQTVDAATENAKQLAAQSKKAANAMHRSLGKAAGTRPLTTIAIAAAGGIVGAKMLGWLWRR